jgi:hypothetical protein
MLGTLSLTSMKPPAATSMLGRKGRQTWALSSSLAR